MDIVDSDIVKARAPSSLGALGGSYAGTDLSLVLEGAMNKR
jgi:hypothetical protein